MRREFKTEQNRVELILLVFIFVLFVVFLEPLVEVAKELHGMSEE